MSLYCAFDFEKRRASSYTLAGSLSRPILVILISRQSPPPPPPPQPQIFNRKELWGVRTFAQISDGTLFCQSNGKRRDGARIIISLQRNSRFPLHVDCSLLSLVSLLFSVKQTLPSARINFSSASKRHGCSLESSISLIFPRRRPPGKKTFRLERKKKGEKGVEPCDDRFIIRAGWEYIPIM